jgi:nondiscriminating aspartyl-tRNA synthetase
MRVSGWVSELRDFGGLRFIILRDSHGLRQITLPKKVVSPEIFKAFEKLTKESVIVVEGEEKRSEKAMNKREIIPKKIEMVTRAEQPVPLDISGKIDSSLDARLDWRSIDLRRPGNQAIFRIQSKIVRFWREYLDHKGFTEVFTPCIMGAASEGGADVFTVSYFDKKAFLRQDPQLHRQLTLLAGFDKIYDLGPNWRAERSHTTRHVTEYHSCAVELSGIRNEYDVMGVEEEMVRYSLNKISKDEDFKSFNGRLEVPKKFPVVEFPKVYEVLEKVGRKVREGEAIDTEGELLLGEYVKKKHKSDFFFLNKFPSREKPFYVMKDGVYARSTDLIFRGMEMSSGGQREHRYEEIIKNIEEKKLSPKNLEWFTKFFKYGAPTHGGFAIGVERFVKQLLGLQNIRETILFPRDVYRISP